MITKESSSYMKGSVKLEYVIIGLLGFFLLVGIIAFSFNLSVGGTQVSLLIMLFLTVLGIAGIIIFVEKRENVKYMTTEEAYKYIRDFWTRLRREELTTERSSMVPWTPPGTQKHFYVAILHRLENLKPVIFYLSTSPRNVWFVEYPTPYQLMNPLDGFASEFEKMYGGVVARKYIPGIDTPDRPPSQTAVYVDTGKKPEPEEISRFRLRRKKPKE